MSIELVDSSKHFEVQHPSGAVFVLRYWTMGMQEEVERRCMIIAGKDIHYNTGLDREMKIEFSVVNWKGIVIEGVEAPCNPENRKRLPVGVSIWLQKIIEEHAGLRITEEEKKN